MPDFTRRGSWLVALLTVVAIPSVLAQGSTVDEIAKYRAALQDGNPAELWEARGEELWKQKRGPRQVSLEQCDLGLGAGVVKGAYARLPRYFADAQKVMDVEARILWCMEKLQGFNAADLTKKPHPAGGQPVDDVVGDAVAFLLAHLQILRQRRVLGVLHEQIAQQQSAALHVAPRLLDQRHQVGVDARAKEAHRARILGS